MTATINFGVGYTFARRTDAGATPTPVYFGVAQDLMIDHERKLVELRGQFAYPVDVAGGEASVKGSIKFARLSASVANDLILGGTLTQAAGRQVSVVVNGLPETAVFSATVTVAHAATFAEDLGVFYHATGKQLLHVASAPALGQYSVVETTGVYSFNASEVAGTVFDFFYEYSVTTNPQIVLQNPLMGASPAYELHIQQYYVNNGGVLTSIHYKLNAVRSSKLTTPFKNGAYTIGDLAFTAFADQSGQVLTYTFGE